MKKLNSQKPLLFLALLFLFFSCKKDILTTVNDESTNLNKQAKESLTVQKVSYKDFLKTVRSEQLGTLKEVLFRSEVTGGINNFNVKVNSEPDMLLLMDQIKKVKTNNFTTYTIPLANKSNNLKEFKNLLVSEKGDETTAILITYKPDESWIKAHDKGLYVPFHGKIFRKVIDLKANKSISKAGGISVATVFCQFIQVVAPVAVSCNGTEEDNNLHWPGEPCQNDGVDPYNAPRYVYVTKLVKDCQDDGTALPPELWRQAPVEVTPLGPILHPPTEPTPPPPPCLAGIDGTCDGSTPPPPPPISLVQFLFDQLQIEDENYRLILNANSSLQSAIYTYAQSNGYDQEDKDFVNWVLSYFYNNINVNSNEFIDEYLHGYNLNNPIDLPQNNIINNGIEISDAPLVIPSTPKPLIGFTTNRNNIEDLTHGTNHNSDRVNSEVLNRTDDQLFNSFHSLMDTHTPFDTELRQVAHDFVEIFRTNNNSNNVVTSTILNRKIDENEKFTTFLQVIFGERFRSELTRVNGNINNMNPINLSEQRPIFNGGHNLWHGLTILMKNTEETTIRLESFELIPNSGGKWIAVVEVTILDHFGLDKNDVLGNQSYHLGFASWWTLQHRRNYVPFITKAIIRKSIIGYL